ncbi:unnamed protein product, partial [Discosporangium mesarthrocarpum]
MATQELPSTRRREQPQDVASQGAKATGGVGARSAKETSPAQEIIECRKKNSKGEEVVVHRYLKGRLLGKGGFAKCFKVTCVATGRHFAMKIVPKSTLTKSRARQKLQTEIKIHRTLQHPRVVRFEMFFEDRENVYILLELCTNHSLSELLRKERRFTEAESRRYMLQILEATDYLHRHQIIHRDLKLGNLFLDRDWNIKAGDFGLAAKLAEENERKRTICGTPNYIAPEILEGKAGHSYQVDVWSVGVILYTMLVGRPPYESRDVKSTYRRILANVYAFPDSVPIGDSAKNLIGRLLQVKPELRPSLTEILNHPFLRNGGPPLVFGTSHTLQGGCNALTGPASSKLPPNGGGSDGSGDSAGAGGAGGSATGLGDAGSGAGGARKPLHCWNCNSDGTGGSGPGTVCRSTEDHHGTGSGARAGVRGSAAAPTPAMRSDALGSGSGSGAGMGRVVTTNALCPLKSHSGRGGFAIYSDNNCGYAGAGAAVAAAGAGGQEK